MAYRKRSFKKRARRRARKTRTRKRRVVVVKPLKQVIRKKRAMKKKRRQNKIEHETFVVRINIAPVSCRLGTAFGTGLALELPGITPDIIRKQEPRLGQFECFKVVSGMVQWKLNQKHRDLRPLEKYTTSWHGGFLDNDQAPAGDLQNNQPNLYPIGDDNDAMVTDDKTTMKMVQNYLHYSRQHSLMGGSRKFKPYIRTIKSASTDTGRVDQFERKPEFSGTNGFYTKENPWHAVNAGLTYQNDIRIGFPNFEPVNKATYTYVKNGTTGKWTDLASVAETFLPTEDIQCPAVDSGAPACTPSDILNKERDYSSRPNYDVTIYYVVKAKFRFHQQHDGTNYYVADAIPVAFNKQKTAVKRVLEKADETVRMLEPQVKKIKEEIQDGVVNEISKSSPVMAVAASLMANKYLRM